MYQRSARYEIDNLLSEENRLATVTPLDNTVGVLRLLHIKTPDPFLVGRPGYDPVELGAVVVDQSDIFSHYVVDFPLVPHLMKLVVE